MVDDIEMARPKGLLILFTSFKLLDILDDAAFRHVVNAMRAYVETGSEPEGLEPMPCRSRVIRWCSDRQIARQTALQRVTSIITTPSESACSRACLWEERG